MRFLSVFFVTSVINQFIELVASSRSAEAVPISGAFSVRAEARDLVNMSGSLATKSLANLMVSLTLSVPFTM
jgi:hypothetical protein